MGLPVPGSLGIQRELRGDIRPRWPRREQDLAPPQRRRRSRLGQIARSIPRIHAGAFSHQLRESALYAIVWAATDRFRPNAHPSLQGGSRMMRVSLLAALVAGLALSGCAAVL